MLFKFDETTNKHTEIKDITHLVQKAVTDSRVRDGICTVFINRNMRREGQSR